MDEDDDDDSDSDDDNSNDEDNDAFREAINLLESWFACAHDGDLGEISYDPSQIQQGKNGLKLHLQKVYPMKKTFV
jgi:hypothetical protein